MSRNLDLVKQYLEAYAAKDLAQISALISADVELQDWNISGVGAEFFLSQTEKNFHSASEILINIKSLHESEFAVAAELEIILNGGAEEIHVVDVVSINSTGQIKGIRAYKG